MGLKGLYFTIDGLFAAILILSTLVIVSTYYFEEDQSSQITYLSSDLVNVLSNIKVNEINDTTVKTWIQQGNITHPNNTVIEQIGEFYVSNNSALATELSRIVSEKLIPEKFGFEVFINNGSILRNESFLQRLDDRVSYRRMVSGLEKFKPIRGTTSNVFLEGIAEKTDAAYVYFGGYVGQGNITKFNNDIPLGVNITHLELELDAGGNFSFYINAQQCGSTYSPTMDNMSADYWDISSCNTSIITGARNNFSIVFDEGISKSYIGGGFIKITYKTSQMQHETSNGDYTYWFPGVEGIINLYSAFYVPGVLQNLTVFLHYYVNATNATNTTLYLTIGNATVLRVTNLTGEGNLTLYDANLTGDLSYVELGNKTVPFRLGFENLSFQSILNGGNADIILITDVSGSMDWSIGSDRVTGVSRDCTDPNLYNSDTKRISLAQCLDKSFVDNILNTSNNRVGLVAYSGNPNYIPTSSSTIIGSIHDLSNDSVSLHSQIDSYSPGGATGLCGSIRQARIMLSQQSNASRQKFILVMTDGLANVQCSPTNENSTTGCIPELCPSNTYCFGGGCVYRVAEDVGYRSNPGVGFNITGKNTWEMIAGESSGVFNGYYWNNTAWITDASIVTGLGDLGDFSVPAVLFNLTGDSKWTLISGKSDGKFKGYYWDGAQWVSDSSRAAGLGDVGSRSSPNAAFNLTGDSRWTLISGEYYGKFKGFYWDGGTWVSDNSRASGLGDVGYYSNPSMVFNLTGEDVWTLVSGEYYGGFYGFRWNGAQWVSNSSMSSGLQDVGYLSAPIMDYNITGDNAFVLLTGEYYGNYFTYYWDNGNWILVCGDYVSDRAFKDAVSDSCSARNSTNVVVHSIGFGPVAYCPIAKSYLQDIASCGNGSFYSSTNATGLMGIYDSIAQEIITVSRQAQTISVQGDITRSILYDNSYIQMNYSPMVQPPLFGEISLILEQSDFDNCSFALVIPNNLRIIDAKLTSYSSEHWTDALIVNNQEIYNLSRFSAYYPPLGDPFVINIPPSVIQSGTNSFLIRTGDSPQNNTGCSLNNTFIYTATVQSSVSYSDVLEKAEGCNWFIEFENGGNTTMLVPPSYAGSKNCSYANASISYDLNDTYDDAMFNLLNRLDLDDDGRLFIDLVENNFVVGTLSIGKIPYPWGPAIAEVRVWK